MADKQSPIISIRHPRYLRDAIDWTVWRDTFEGGEYYRDHYLLKFSDRETDAEFKVRKNITPIPTFAKSAVLDIRNSIYQRLVGVSRVGGSRNYQAAVAGEGGGVDGEGSSMDAFMGNDVLKELLVMGRVGVYIDAAPPEGDTMADQVFPPYLTFYPVEDILSYTLAPRSEGGEFKAVLLRDWNATVTTQTAGIELPSGTRTQYRLVWKDEMGNVWYRLYDDESKVIYQPDSVEDGAVLTDLKRVPFVMPDIGDSLLKDVASYQRSLLNLISSDVYYAIKSNSPFLTIQRDQFKEGDHLKRPESDTDDGHSENVGSGKGRYYGINEARPEYIAPPTDPLEASMKLQERLEDSIRTLVNLAVQSKAGSRTESAESKKISQSGLEAGLSFIGMVMETAEKQIAKIWAEYEDTNRPNPATVSYPARYTLKSDDERMDEAKQQLDLIERLPGRELKKEVSIRIVDTLLSDRIPRERIEAIKSEIRRADYVLSDRETVELALERGLTDDRTGAMALGFNPDLVPQAREDRAERVKLTLEAQTSPDDTPERPAARGAPDLDPDPNSGEDEKEEADE